MDAHSAEGERRGRGFTLVELLVVVAVITILASLLMPTAVRAIAAGQAARCESNLHQIGAAFMTYVHGFAGMMPSHDDEPGLTFDVWGKKMWWRFAHGQVVPFMAEHKVFMCPADSNVKAELGVRIWFSYTWNTRVGCFNHSSKVYRHRNIAECTSPSMSIIFLDGTEGDGGTDGNDDRPYQPGGATGGYRVGYARHSGGFHALFVDRHVERFLLGETEAANYDW